MKIKEALNTFTKVCECVNPEVIEKVTTTRKHIISNREKRGILYDKIEIEVDLIIELLKSELFNLNNLEVKLTKKFVNRILYIYIDASYTDIEVVSILTSKIYELRCKLSDIVNTYNKTGYSNEIEESLIALKDIMENLF